MPKRMVVTSLFILGLLWSLRVVLFYCHSCVGSIDVPRQLEASCGKFEQVSVTFEKLGPPRYVRCSDAVDALSRGELLSVHLVVDSSRAPSLGLLQHIKLCEFSTLGGSGEVTQAEACRFESNGF